jgi:putative DNA primase/helicase
MDKWWKQEDKRVEKTVATGVAMSLKSVLHRGVRWLWPGRIVSENLTLLVGDPDVGKSLVAMDLAARVSQGTDWPDGEPNGKPGGVLLLSAEDHLFFTVGPALSAAGADATRISSLWDVRVQEKGEVYRRPLELNRDMDVLRAMVREVADCKLVVIDPISAFLGRTNQRNTLSRLAMLAGDLHVAVVGIAHLRPGGRQAMHRTLGGMSLTSAARAVWMVAEDRREVGSRKSEVGSQKAEVGGQESGAGTGGRRLLLPVKNNLVRERTGLEFRLVATEGSGVPWVEWGSEKIDETADEVLETSRHQFERGPDRLEEAMDFLRELLAGGPRLVKDVEADGWTKRRIRYRTLIRARKELGVKVFRKETTGPWWMHLPEGEGDGKKECKTVGTLDDVGTLAKNTGNSDSFPVCPSVPDGIVGEGGNAEIGMEGEGELPMGGGEE